MPILRHVHERDYTVIPNSLLRDEALSMRDVGILCYMLSLPDGWEFSIRGLASMLPRDGRDSVATSLKAIEAAGYLHRAKSRGESGKLSGYIWEISDTPEFRNALGEPNNERLCSDLPDTVLPDTAEPSQIKYLKKKLTTKKGGSLSTHTKFIPPGLEEVRAYVNDCGCNIDAELFLDYYTANGWIQGKGKPVKDWKACVRTWAKRQREGTSSSLKHNIEPMLVSDGKGGYIWQHR